MFYADKHIMPLFSACLEGFIGKECTKSCLYPTYGRNCQFICNCTKEYCNVSTGCLQGKFQLKKKSEKLIFSFLYIKSSTFFESGSVSLIGEEKC